MKTFKNEGMAMPNIAHKPKADRRPATDISGIIKVMLEDGDKMKKVVELPCQAAPVTEYFWKGKGVLTAPFHQPIYYEFDKDGVQEFGIQVLRDPEPSQREVEVMRQLLQHQSLVSYAKVGKPVEVVSELSEIDREVKMRAKRLRLTIRCLGLNPSSIA